MKIHKEGYATLIVSFLVLCAFTFGCWYFLGGWMIAFVFSLILYVFLLRFFRVPDRDTPSVKSNEILSPCDGKIVVIEDVFEPEYFKEKRKQISIFMSPNNVHVNWAPCSGKVVFSKYHPGKHLAAWNPKSSTDNERTSIVFQTKNKVHVLVRQIAGALARRIVHYTAKDKTFQAGEEFGFIKLGSRVDVFLPLDTQINVTLGDVVQGKQTTLAFLTQ